VSGLISLLNPTAGIQASDTASTKPSEFTTIGPHHDREPRRAGGFINNGQPGPDRGQMPPVAPSTTPVLFGKLYAPCSAKA
jgi:hypothetical protein